MRVFQPMYKNSKGKWTKQRKFWIELRDHVGIVRAFPALGDKQESRLLGQQIQRLVNCRANRELPKPELSRWLDNVPDKLADKLVKFDLISPRRAAANKSLDDLLADFEPMLLEGRGTPTQAALVM